MSQLAQRVQQMVREEREKAARQRAADKRRRRMDDDEDREVPVVNIDDDENVENWANNPEEFVPDVAQDIASEPAAADEGAEMAKTKATAKTTKAKKPKKVDDGGKAKRPARTTSTRDPLAGIKAKPKNKHRLLLNTETVLALVAKALKAVKAGVVDFELTEAEGRELDRLLARIKARQ